MQIAYSFLSFFHTNITIFPCHPTTVENLKKGDGSVALRCLCKAREQQENEMAQKPLQMKMDHQNAFVYWSNITFFETAARHGTSFLVELTVKQSLFLFMNDVLKGDGNL